MANDFVAILVNYICPGLGVILSNLMWMTSLPLILAVRYITTSFDDIKGISTINPYPYLFMVLNCLSWTIYGYFIYDYFVVFSNVFGFLLGFFYTLTSLTIFRLLWKGGDSEEKEKELREEEINANSQRRVEVSDRSVIHSDPQQVYQADDSVIVQVKVKSNEYYRSYQIVEIILFSILIFWLIIGIVNMILLHRDLSDTSVQSATNLIGMISLIFTITYYGSPLTLMATVIRQRDSSSLYFPMILVNCINATLWFFYGFFGIRDLYIWLPNAIGVMLALIQLLLIYLFPAHHSEEAQFFTFAEIKSLLVGELPESRQNLRRPAKSPLFDI